MRKIMFIKICTCNLKKIVLMKFWFMGYENIQFSLQYMNHIHIEYFNFFVSIPFYLLIIP